MQEFKYFRDGATLVISLDCLNWGSKRRCSENEIKKRDEELQLLISSSRRIQAVEELRPITCLCIFDQRGSEANQSWRISDPRSSLVTRLPSFSIPLQHCRLPVESIRHSMLTSLASFAPEWPKEALRTRLIINMQDIFSFIKKDLNIKIQQDTVTKSQHNRFVIFCDQDIPLQLFGDTCPTESCRTSIGYYKTGWHFIENNVSSDLKNSTALSPNNNENSEGIQHKVVRRASFHTCNPESPLKFCQMYGAAGLSGRSKNVKKRKSVSFDDDVMVYLFDQESPTLELHSGPCTSMPSSYSCNLPDVTLEDSGTNLKDCLEWEDDFSALDKSCHFHCVRESESQHYALSRPSCPALSRHFFLSQTCLFLTHVTESDLEL